MFTALNRATALYPQEITTFFDGLFTEGRLAAGGSAPVEVVQRHGPTLAEAPPGSTQNAVK